MFRVANKFEDDICFELWPMELETYDDALNWITENYNPDDYTLMEWVIVHE